MTSLLAIQILLLAHLSHLSPKSQIQILVFSLITPALKNSSQQ